MNFAGVERDTTVTAEMLPLLQRLSALHPKIIDLSLDRIHRLLGRLGNPETRMPPVVHVAGTNGKGSVLAFLRAFLEAAGYRVHVYTSPHLVRFNERFRLAGTLIEDEALAAILEECEAANGGAPITFFEIITAAAFLAFSRRDADITLLETGLGGRLDATNVIGRPAVTAITPISIDHTQFLGNSLEAIAGEKAGILKPGVPAVIARQPAAAAMVIAERAASCGAPLLRQDHDWTVAAAGKGMRYGGKSGEMALPTPALAGEHQIMNAGQAIAIAAQLNLARVDAEAIGEGLARATWPGRLQRLRTGPLVDRLSSLGWEVWLDGGHNPGAAAALAAACPRLGAAGEDRPSSPPLHIIFGMLQTKDVDGFLAPLAPLAASLHHVPIGGDHASLEATAAQAAARRLGLTCHSAASVEAAVANVIAAEGKSPGKSPGKSAQGSQGRVLICGSLYLAGEVLSRHN